MTTHDKKGVAAIIFLQRLINCEETEEDARESWEAMCEHTQALTIELAQASGFRFFEKGAARTRSKIYVEMLVEMHASLPTDAVVIGTNLAEMQALLKHGAEMSEVDAHRSIALRQKHDLKNKECFFNAQLLAFVYDSLEYCEGIASSVIPTEHAWLVDETGRVIDPTWIHAALPDEHPHVPRMIDYFGVKIPKKDLKRIWKKNRERAMPMLCDYLKIERKQFEG